LKPVSRMFASWTVPIFIGLLEAPQNAIEDGYIKFLSGCISYFFQGRRPTVLSSREYPKTQKGV